MYVKFALIFLGLNIGAWLGKVQSQTFFPTKTYTTGLFRNPLAIPMSLVGNFGECRPNHFHSGIDIRTNGKENLPVFAIEQGFVSRVKIESGGFGNALYITHPSGVTSLYAHLNSFYPELETYIREQQYLAKSWKLDMTFPPGQFIIAKGKQIALSGNTGGSQGPHLHLEIRDTKTDAPLNPLLFFTDLVDTKPPIFKQLAVYDAHTSIYEQRPKLYSVIQGRLKSDTLILNGDQVFFGIVADDYMDNAGGTLGIYEMRLYVDNQPYFGWQMDNISYDDTRYMNALADYKTKKNNGPWIQLCHQLPNDHLGVYKSFTKNKGIIPVAGDELKKIRVEILDTRNHKTTLSFYIKGKSYTIKNRCDNEIIAGKAVKVNDENLSLELSSTSLYDNICYTTQVSPLPSAYSHMYQIHKGEVPLHDYVKVSLQPKSAIPSSMKDKVALVRYPYGKEKAKKGAAAIVDKNKVIGQIRDFGNYEIVIDQQPPNIITYLKEGESVSKKKILFFNIKDDITSVANVQLNADGAWLRTVQKGDTYYYEMDEHFPLGKHTLMVKASDENNNTKTISITLIK